MPDGRYSKAVSETQPDSFPPPVKDVRPAKSVALPDPSAPASVSFHGPNWRVTIPVALIIAAASFFGGRQTAAYSSTSTQQLVEIQAETRSDVADIKRDVEAIRENVSARDNALNNRLLIVETRLANLPTSRP